MAKKIKKFKIPNFLKIHKRRAIIFIASFCALSGFGVLYFAHGPYPNLFGRTIDIETNIEKGEVVKFDTHPLTGRTCENAKSRPIAVMLAEDPVTRPLSGISKADLVVEMPVVKDGITRIMAVFVCEEPEEIGSVRSSRDDFIPLAASFDAIYAHWGGSHFALDRLNGGAVDNIDALINPFSVFFRKNTIAAPHNGFTSYEKLRSTAEKLGYRTNTLFEGYPRAQNNPDDSGNSVTISVEYPYPVNVSYIYNRDKNIYYRWRGGTPEYDKIDGSQASASVLVVMKTQTRNLEGEYNDVDVTGEGEAFIFQNGRMEKVKWKKAQNPTESKLGFFDSNGNEVPFVPGKIWIHVTDTYTNVLWGEKIAE
ncbi:MAG: DUF3048 domain-containing protein [Candidatus Spechtbacterales bacterium]